MAETHLYRLWHGSENNRSEIARFKAEDFETVSDYVRKEFLAPEAEIESEFGDELILYLNFNVCKGCEGELNGDRDEEACEYCERAEWLQIEQYDEIEPEFDTIYGTSEFYDLTKPEGEEKGPDWAPMLKTAWEKDPQGGAEASIAKLVEDNPELAKGVDSELLKRGRAALKGEGA